MSKYPIIENPSTTIFWKDLHDEPGLKMCSLAAQGLWTHHMLAIMAGAGGYLSIMGKALTVPQLAAYVGKSVSDVQAAYDELLALEVFSLDRAGTPYNRRLVRAEKRASSNRKNGKNGGRPKSLNAKANPDRETQTRTQSKPNTKPKRNPNRPPPRARLPLSQVSPSESVLTDRPILAPEPDAPAPPNGHHRRRHAEGMLQGGQVVQRIIAIEQLPDTADARKAVITAMMELESDEIAELHDYATSAHRVSELARDARQRMWEKTKH